MKFKSYVLVGTVFLCLLAAWLLWIDVPAKAFIETSEVTASRDDSVASPFGSLFSGAGKANSFSAGPSAPKDKLAAARIRYEDAALNYNHYRDTTRYPFTSRPSEQHPDVSHPFKVKIYDAPLVTSKGNKNNNIRAMIGQDRVFLSGADSVKFTLQVLDSEGRVLPLTISSATAKQVLPRKDALRYDKQQLAALRTTNLTFTDSGLLTGVDDVANDKVYSVRFTPQKQGFEGFSGIIRTVVSFKADGVDNFATFLVTYTGEVHATWIDSVREVQESGSLNLYLKALIAVPGRYVVTGRVDDANGKSFAHLIFNDEVKAGEQEFKLHLFGALIRDKRPVFPLKLRDVEAYHLLLGTSPDRVMMAPRKGLVHTSGKYLLESFSPAEWTSEQRTRYLTEYKRILEDAKEELEALTSAN